jgi:hypothetical protein
MVSRKRECPKCTLRQTWLPAENTFEAHFFYGDRAWCSGGKKPSKEQIAARKAGKRGRSIRAVSGGLPS